MEGKIEALVARLQEARGQLNQALESISTEIEIYPSWKLKQLLDHITGWDELMVSVFHTHALGGIPARTVKHGLDQYNQDMINTRTALTLDESRQAYAASRAAMIQALGEIPPERLEEPFKAPWGGKCTVEHAVDIFVSHEKEHASHIYKSLKRNP